MITDAIRQDLGARYAEPHRAYHTWDHIQDMLDLSKGIEHLLTDRAAFAIAILFHDAIYDPLAGDNEERSAALMREKVSGCVPVSTIDAAQALILATKTHRPGAHPDAAFLIDIDLAILGAEPQRFDTYDTAIRKEYAHVPEAVYRVGRARVLQSFLDRERIFCTDQFSRLERQARSNLTRAVARL
jgi:predicted metal-dependent HD superfamily phosphohydrolase